MTKNDENDETTGSSTSENLTFAILLRSHQKRQPGSQREQDSSKLTTGNSFP